MQANVDASAQIKISEQSVKIKINSETKINKAQTELDMQQD